MSPSDGWTKSAGVTSNLGSVCLRFLVYWVWLFLEFFPLETPFGPHLIHLCIHSAASVLPMPGLSLSLPHCSPLKNALSMPREQAAPQLFALSPHKSAPWWIRTLQETRLSSVLKSPMLTNYTAKSYYTLQQTSQRHVIGKLSSKERPLIYDRLSATLH